MYKIEIIEKGNKDKLFAIINGVHHIEKIRGHAFLYGDEKEQIYLGIINLVYCDLIIERIDFKNDYK